MSTAISSPQGHTHSSPRGHTHSTHCHISVPLLPSLKCLEEVNDVIHGPVDDTSPEKPVAWHGHLKPFPDRVTRTHARMGESGMTFWNATTSFSLYINLQNDVPIQSIAITLNGHLLPICFWLDVSGASLPICPVNVGGTQHLQWTTATSNLRPRPSPEGGGLVLHRLQVLDGNQREIGLLKAYLSKDLCCENVAQSAPVNLT